MALVIPNEECYIGFVESPATISDLCAPSLAGELSSMVDVTCFVSSINATAQGNTIPAPRLCSLFETTVPGTSSAQFSAEFYREKPTDTAWDLLTRKTSGYFIICRFGVDYTNGTPVPKAGDVCEVWPVEITSRAAGPMASGTPMSFTVTAAVNIVPCEDAALAA